MPELAIEVLRRRDLPSRDPARGGRFDRLVFYRVENDASRVYTVELPAETWSQQLERDAIARAERERRLATPTRYSVPG